MMFNPLYELKVRITKKGGFVNAHAHLDRANTVTRADFNADINKQLHEKWKVVDQIKRSLSTEEYFQNMKLALMEQALYNVKSVLSFIDVDEVCEYRPLLAAIEAKKFAKDLPKIDLKIACQTLKGVLSPISRKYIESSIEKFDVIGSLPAADKNLSKHLDVVMGWAKDTGKRLHVHVDQLNTTKEKETELLARKTIEHGLEGMVTAVHSISLAAHNKDYREEVYAIAKDAGLSFISCPTAWIDSRRNENLSVTHNATTPVDELVERGFVVGIGSDNIHDVYKPFSDGDMFTELRVLLESNHLYDMDVLCDIATKNGHTIIGS